MLHHHKIDSIMIPMDIEYHHNQEQDTLLLLLLLLLLQRFLNDFQIMIYVNVM
jgi:hypothetical protein